jgi:5-methylcytosine-specific restriction enzyme subunit McrC
MNQLFESFVAGFVRRYRQEILPPALQGCALLVQTRGARRYMAQQDRHPVFLLQPDLAFELDGRFLLLLDTKYKQLDIASRRLGVAPDDLYQMFACAHGYKCPQVVMLYPQTADTGQALHATFLVEGCESAIRVATIDLRLDLARDVPAFKEALKSILQEEVVHG